MLQYNTIARAKNMFWFLCTSAAVYGHWKWFYEKLEWSAFEVCNTLLLSSFSASSYSRVARVNVHFVVIC